LKKANIIRGAPRRYSTVAVVLIVVALVALTALAAREIDRALTERMAELKSQTIAALEATAGRKISYSSIAPSIFQYLEVRDLVFHESESSEKALLALHDIRVYYSLVHLLLRRDPVGALREVQIRNTRLTLDLDKDRDVIEILRRLTGTGGGEGRLRARITGANVSISLASAGTTVSLDNSFFQIESRKEAIAVSLRGDLNGTLPTGFTFGSSLKVQGLLDKSLASSDLTVQLLSFESSLFTTRSQTLQVLWKGSSIEVRKIQDRSPINLSILADLEKQQFTINFQTEDLRPDRLFTLSGGLARYENWMKMPLTASGHLTYRAPDRSLDYQADISAFLEDQLPVRQVTLVSSFRGSEKEAFFEPLRLSSAGGALDFEGSLLFSNFFPEGILTLANVDPGTGEKLDANLSIERQKDAVTMKGTHLVFGELGFDLLSVSLSPLKNGFRFTLGTSFAGARPGDMLQASGDLRFGQPFGRAVVEGSPRAIGAPSISLSGMLHNVPPAKLFQLFEGGGALSGEQKDLYEILARFSVSADVALSTDFSKFSISSREVTVTQPDEPSTLIRFGLTADSEHVALSEFSGAWRKLSLLGAFDCMFAQDGQITFASDLRFQGTPYSISGRYSRSLGLHANGSYGLVLAAVPMREGVLALRLKGDRFPLPLPGRAMAVSFDMNGIATPEGDWSADFPLITLYDVPFLESTANTIQLTGKASPRGLTVTRLLFADAYSSLEGSASAEIVQHTSLLDPHFLESLSAQGHVTLRSSDGVESYAATGALKEGTLSLTGQFAGSPLARIGTSAVKGVLEGTTTLTGPVRQPSAVIVASLKDGRLGTDSLSLGGHVTLLPDTIRVSQLGFSYLSHTLSEGAGTVNTKSGAFSFTGLYQGEYFSDQVKLTLGLDGQLTADSLDSLLAGILDHGLKGRLALSGITVAAAPVPAWSVDFRSDGGRLSFDGGPGGSLHGWIDSRRSFSVSLAGALPLRGSAVGRIAGDHITATLNVDALQMVVLNSLLKSPPIPTSAGPFPVIRVTAGVASGRLNIDGAVNDPDFSGQLDLAGGGIMSAYSPDEAGPIRDTLTFSGKTFRAPRTFAAAGAALLSAEASFTIDHWSPVAFDISINSVGDVPLRMRGRFGRLIADGSASGQVRIAGDERKTNITGSLKVGDCKIALGDFAQGKFVPEDTPTFVTLTAETGKRVEFTWPTENLPVLRTMASPGGKIVVTYRGDTGAYTVKGAAGVQGGEIYYFDRSFIIKKGSITFNENESTFDPRITANAEVREWDPFTGEEVKIFLDADSALSKFSPRLSSVPARTETALLAMIGAPILTRTETQGPVMAAALVYSDILSQTWLLRPFEQKVRQILNLDMFSIRTQILQNLVAQKLFGTTLNPLDNTSVSLGKYVGNDLFWEMLVRLQSPPLPTGAPLPPSSLQYGQFQTGVSLPASGLPLVGAGLRPEMELSLEWATPLFLLTWSWVPQHPESLFLVDNSLEFSWRFSY
jgi:hypothetical protein